MPSCHICQDDYEPFISFGKMPIANGFLTPDQFCDEYFFEMQTGFCSNCKMVQLVKQPDREKMFHQNYAFFSSTSKYMAQHFKVFADSIYNEHLKSSDPFVVEIGSNDGIMLQNFAQRGIRHLGIEPSTNVAKIAIQKGIQTTSEFFDETLAEKIVSEQGKADAILAANVMCHIPNLHSVAAGVKTLLKPEGVFAFEDPYLGDIVEKTSYDQIYDEHAYYFSVASINYIFQKHDMEIVDVIPQKVHGGSMRYILSHQNIRQISSAVKNQCVEEDRLGLHFPETFEKLGNNINNSRTKLMEMLTDFKKQNKRVVGYAATSKSTTVTNFCGISPDLVEYISDTTPIKQGKYSPGMHIPVRPHEDFCNNYPEYALLFGWNHAEEIMANEQEFLRSGGKWIIYVPEVGILDAS